MPKNRIANTAIDDDFIEKVGGFEEFVPYMYKDNHGNPTAGYGRMMGKVRDAQEMPFWIDAPDGPRYATSSEVEESYNKLKAKPTGNYLADFYDPNSKKHNNSDLLKLYLKEPEAKEVLTKNLREAEENVSTKFPEFESYPKSARQALVDMNFNMHDRFDREYYDKRKAKLTGWPNLFNAVESRDWKKAADESHRTDGKKDRNDSIFNLFMDALEDKATNK